MLDYTDCTPVPSHIAAYLTGLGFRVVAADAASDNPILKLKNFPGQLIIKFPVGIKQKIGNSRSAFSPNAREF